MKYLSIINSKYSLLGILVLFFVASTQAQKNTDSPYSRYGGGLIQPLSLNGNFAMGGVGYAWRPFQYKPVIYDSLARSNAKLNDRGTNFLNLKNPASISNISLTTFEAGVLSKNANYTSSGQSRTGTNTQLSHMAIGLPIGEKWGVSFGIRPYTSVGYDYRSFELLSDALVTYDFDGSGGINEVFVGTAAQLSQSISVGVRGKYLFGRVEDNRRVIFDNVSNDFFNTLDQRELRVRDFALDFGVQYVKEYNKDYRWIVGATISPIDEVKTKENQLIRNYDGNENFENFKDTVTFFEDRSSKMPIAADYGIGIGFEKKKKWIIALDYTNRQWSNSNITSDIVFNSAHLVNLGFEKYNKVSGFDSYLGRLGLRAGMRYNSSIINIDGEDVEEFGIGIGISMPLKKSFSTLNIGAEIGRRGKDKNGLIQEDFLNIQLGITINDKWFIKRQYD